MNVFAFMANSPILTFFLALVALALCKALMRFITIAVNGYPPMWCDSEGRFKEDKERNES